MVCLRAVVTDNQVAAKFLAAHNAAFVSCGFVHTLITVPLNKSLIQSVKNLECAVERVSKMRVTLLSVPRRKKKKLNMYG